MKKPKFTEIYKWAIISVLAAIIGFVINDLEPLGNPQKYYFILYLFIAFIIATAVIQLVWTAVIQITSNIKSFFKTPNFRNVKVAFLEAKQGAILIQIHNKEWRYPEIQVEAIIDISHAKPNKQLIPELGLVTNPDYLSNLKWKEGNNPGLSTIKKKQYKHLLFAQTNSAKNDFYLDVWSGNPPRFSVGNHEIWVVLYITIGNFRIARTLVVDMDFEGDINLSVVKTTQLQDMPQFI